MTREEYIDFANALKNNYTIDFDKLPEFCDMAISALSEDGEYIKKEDTIEYLNDLFGEMYHVSFGNVLQSIDSLQTYSFPDSAEIESTTVDELKDILKWGHCYCDSEGLPAYKAIKNAIEIITSLERLKAEIENNAEHCECVPDGSCIRVDKVLEIIDKYLGGKDK